MGSKGAEVQREVRAENFYLTLTTFRAISRNMRFGLFSLTLLSGFLASVLGTQAAEAASLSVIARGLDNVRGLSFGTDGALYVTEAGLGGTGACVPAPSGAGSLCYGTTGAVTKIQNGIQERVLTNLPSLASPDGSGAFGAQDIKFDSTGKPFVLVGYGADPALRDGTSDLGKLLAADFQTNSWTSIADLAGYELANNPDRADVGSNPIAFLLDGDKAIAVDAGGNDLLSVGTDGSNLSAIAALPQKLLTDPVFPPSDSVPFDPTQGPSPDDGNAPPSQFSIQATPTGVALGSDGAYYVSQFTGFPFPENGASIYRVTPDGETTVYADGFTQLTDLEFDADGNLYALQYANQSAWKGNLDGSLIQIAPDGTRTTLFSGNGLVSPSALTLGPDGAIYVNNLSDRPGQGQVLRIDTTVSVPEPNSVLGILAVGALGISRSRKGKQKAIEE